MMLSASSSNCLKYMLNFSSLWQSIKVTALKMRSFWTFLRLHLSLARDTPLQQESYYPA